ncbi:hypothetical protein PVAP13_5KG350200 [Panicum virgatum]|uniref:Uncharacterized protein n=1 Tax=Panicum virgatum TaxID=38727 RepID=A0A8T0SHT4_PANVG|nr:hypothetical protein PVAP13_5KG350200 [Panicum virgatum]
MTGNPHCMYLDHPTTRHQFIGNVNFDARLPKMATGCARRIDNLTGLTHAHTEEDLRGTHVLRSDYS